MKLEVRLKANEPVIKNFFFVNWKEVCDYLYDQFIKNNEDAATYIEKTYANELKSVSIHTRSGKLIISYKTVKE